MGTNLSEFIFGTDFATGRVLTTEERTSAGASAAVEGLAEIITAGAAPDNIFRSFPDGPRTSTLGPDTGDFFPPPLVPGRRNNLSDNVPDPAEVRARLNASRASRAEDPSGFADFSRDIDRRFGPNSSGGISNGVEGRDFFREVEITDLRGNPVGEFDEIDFRNGIFFEDKSASGLNIVNPRTGLPAQTPQQFVDRQIVGKTRNRINNLLNVADSTRSTVNGTQNTPDLSDIRDIRSFVFRVEANSPELRTAVDNGLNQLRSDFPDFQFDVQFGR
ncbi:hypothetical protein [Synechococcus sp. PCC 7336]|uniref:hypothetical protein n=1 Tax=Synechococcus sp. PCC 7336 TaxID=195250 RepID=UPI00034737AB|nr:hypothetical protein [Synechococcus sp. PCC 7336]